MFRGANAIVCAILVGGIRKKGKPIGGFRFFERIIIEMADCARSGMNLGFYKNELWRQWVKVRERYPRQQGIP